MTSKKKIYGNQTPYNLLEFPGDDTHGEKAIKLAQRVGIKLLPWQQFVVKACLRQDEEGKWTHTDVIYIIPRQNGKSEILLVIILYKLFVLHEEILFTSQRWGTSEKIAKRFQDGYVARNKSLNSKVKRTTRSQGKATVELKPLPGTDRAGSVTFTTRSGNLGRGFDKIDTLLYDEAYNISDAVQPALLPTQSASKNPQTIYTSSAVNRADHDQGAVLSALREDSLSGQDSERRFFAEWMAPPEMPRDEEATWAFANPSYGYYMNSNSIKKSLRGMNTDYGRQAFDVEILGRGLWFSNAEEEIEYPIDLDAWSKKCNSKPVATGDCSIGVDVSPRGDTCSLVSATRTTGNGIHLTISKIENFKRNEVASAIVSAVKKNDPVAVMYDEKSPSSTLNKLLEEHDIEPTSITLKTVTTSTELFLQLFEEGVITHDGNERFARAIEALRFREVKGAKGRAFTSSEGEDITPIIAATQAVFGLVEFETPVNTQVETKKKYVGKPKNIRRVNRAKQMSF